MKLKLHWAEKYEMVREYPTFELDSENFPELELEMRQVYSAGSAGQQETALADLEYKMHHTTTERGESIFQIVAPMNGFESAHVYPIAEEEGFLTLTDVGGEE